MFSHQYKHSENFSERNQRSEDDGQLLRAYVGRGGKTRRVAGKCCESFPHYFYYAASWGPSDASATAATCRVSIGNFGGKNRNNANSCKYLIYRWAGRRRTFLSNYFEGINNLFGSRESIKVQDLYGIETFIFVHDRTLHPHLSWDSTLDTWNISLIQSMVNSRASIKVIDSMTPNRNDWHR